jgi:hypothetical protein
MPVVITVLRKLRSMAFNSTTFIPDFKKICQLAGKLKWGPHRQHGDFISLLYFLKKENQAKDWRYYIANCLLCW